MERLGIFGGTFDPVHVGHLVAACEARHQLALDRVLLVVAGDPWQKHGLVLAPAAARYEMVVAAVDGVAGLEASRLEIDRPGLTYTMDTVEQLWAPGREIFLIVGSDVAASIDTWERVEELRQSVTLAVVEREGVEPRQSPPGFRCTHVTMPCLEISSSDIRRRIRAGEPIEFLIPAPAARLVRERGLYTDDR